MASKTTSIALGDNLADYARSKVESGEFGSTSEVIRDALRRAKERDLRIEKLRQLIGRFSNGEIPVPGPQNGRYAAEPLGGLTSLRDFEAGKTPYNASAQAAVDLGDTVKRIDGTEVPILTPWLKGRQPA